VNTAVEKDGGLRASRSFERSEVRNKQRLSTTCRKNDFEKVEEEHPRLANVVQLLPRCG